MLYVGESEILKGCLDMRNMYAYFEIELCDEITIKNSIIKSFSP